MAHSKKSRYYFVCRFDSVLTCMCGPKENFNRLRLRCEKKSKRMTNQDRRANEVVDSIVQKYSCLASQEEEQTLENFIPEMTYRSIEVVNHDPVSYLTFRLVV